MKNNIIKIVLTIAVIAAFTISLCDGLGVIADTAPQSLCILDYVRVLC